MRCLLLKYISLSRPDIVVLVGCPHSAYVTDRKVCPGPCSSRPSVAGHLSGNVKNRMCAVEISLHSTGLAIKIQLICTARPVHITSLAAWRFQDFIRSYVDFFHTVLLLATGALVAWFWIASHETYKLLYTCGREWIFFLHAWERVALSCLTWIQSRRMGLYSWTLLYNDDHR